jgi:transposase
VSVACLSGSPTASLERYPINEPEITAVREVKVASEPDALLQILRTAAYHFKRIGLEAGPLSQWLYGALAEAGLPVICVETRHMRAVLKAQINKTDRNDARGMAR